MMRTMRRMTTTVPMPIYMQQHLPDRATLKQRCVGCHRSKTRFWRVSSARLTVSLIISTKRQLVPPTVNAIGMFSTEIWGLACGQRCALRFSTWRSTIRRCARSRTSMHPATHCARQSKAGHLLPSARSAEPYLVRAVRIVRPRASALSATFRSRRSGEVSSFATRVALGPAQRMSPGRNCETLPSGGVSSRSHFRNELGVLAFHGRRAQRVDNEQVERDDDECTGPVRRKNPEEREDRLHHCGEK